MMSGWKVFDAVFFFKQKTAYEMRISDWSSDVCSSDLTPVSDVADVFLDLFRGHAGDRAMFEGEIDERILQSHRLVAAIENIIADRPGQAVPFLHERMEKPRDALAMQALVAHGPAHDLPHALHLVEAREVHQHGEAGERSEEHTSELQSLMRISY